MSRRLPLPTKNTTSRHTSVRVNQNGDEEKVVKQKGKPEVSTLNELNALAENLLDMLEDVEIPSLGPSISAEQPNWQRAAPQPSSSQSNTSRGIPANPGLIGSFTPQYTGSPGEPTRVNNDSMTNMTVAPQTSDIGLGLGPTPADAPEISRTKAPLGATMRGKDLNSKNSYTGDGIDYGATHSEELDRLMANVIESFTGTGAIAFAPMPFEQTKPRKKQRSKKDTRAENKMSARRTINEWLPPFKSGGYTPGDYEMPEPSGTGVVDRTPTKDTVGAYDTDTSADGQEWPREHNETAAMCDVDDDGVEHKPQGGHESSHAEANDGIQTKVSDLNLRTKQKNTGSGVAEPFEGDRWSDGGVLSGKGPGSDTWNREEGPGMPSDGPITGTSGPQLGQFEGKVWSPDNMARLMEEDYDVQALFDSYARTRDAVCVEDFQALCDAHGAPITLDEASLLGLMDMNQEFLFYEGRDSDGPFWQPRPIEECGTNCVEPPKKKGKKLPFKEGKEAARKPINEWQVRSPEEEAGLHNTMPGGLDHEPTDREYGMPSPPPGGPEGYGRTPDIGGIDSSMLEPAAAGGGEMYECPGCGYQGEEEACPDCGTGMEPAMGGAEPPEIGGALASPGGERNPLGAFPTKPTSHSFNPFEDQHGAFEESRRRTIVNGPEIVESLKNFMVSARSLIERNPKARQKDLAEALNHSWAYHAGDVDARACPTKVRQTLQGLMGKYPGFNPLVEEDEGGFSSNFPSTQAMTPPDGSKLGGGNGPKVNLPNRPTAMATKSEKSLLGHAQKNNLGDSGSHAVIAGTAKGMSGHNESKDSPATAIYRNNMQRLAAHVKKSIEEGAKALRGGKYSMEYSVIVTEGEMPDFIKDKIGGKDKDDKKGGKAPPFGKGKEGEKKDKKDKKEPFGGKKAPPFGKGGKAASAKKEKKGTKARDNLAEALADAEEILQLHSPDNVEFETTFYAPNRQIVMKLDTPLFTLGKRGPLVGEGRALFRFHRNAEAFADQLVAEGVTCRIMPHNWGTAVSAKTDYETATNAFRMLSEDDTMSEKKNWMGDVKHTGECTPISKPSCTGKKLAFAKRVQKGGDLHHGGK